LTEFHLYNHIGRVKKRPNRDKGKVFNFSTISCWLLELYACHLYQETFGEILGTTSEEDSLFKKTVYHFVLPVNNRLSLKW